MPALAVAIAIAGTIAAYGVARKSEKQFKGNDISGAQWARGFDLTDHTGRRRTLADFRGKVVLMFFGYTNCPDACPTALAEMAQVVKQLATAGDAVQGLFITVDPERDTAERLAAYVPAFHASFLGLRGSKDDLGRVTKEFKIYFQTQKVDAGGHSGHGEGQDVYLVDHSTGIYAFDKDGRARLYFSASSRTVATMVHDVKLLLEQ
jgi:protein SCO1/2